MVARRDTAPDLEIDDSFGDSIAPHHLIENRVQRPPAHRPVAVEFAERSIEPAMVQSALDQTSKHHGDDFVDAIGKLHAAILDMDPGGGVRSIAAVDVGNTRHDSNVPRTSVSSASRR